MADAITIFRMAASLALLFFPAYSPAFFALYIAAGLSDVFDGIVARETHTACESGAKLDTAADTVFAAACLIRLLPGLRLPLWLYVWIGIIALIKLVNVISGFIVGKKFTVLHTAANKAAGVLLFLLPLTFSRLDPTVSVPPVCAVATFAAIQEGHLIRTGAHAGSGEGGRK